MNAPIATKPKYLEVIPANIPEELKRLSQWVCWKAQWVKGTAGKPGRWAKVPCQPNSHNASVTNPEQWSSFSEVIAVYQDLNSNFDGIGFVLAKDDPFTALDLDKCIDADGNSNEQAKTIIKQMGSYTENSPSGNGIRIFIKGHLPQSSRNRKGHYEVYSQDRYVTVTGHIIEGVTE